MYIGNFHEKEKFSFSSTSNGFDNLLRGRDALTVSACDGNLENDSLAAIVRITET